MTMDNWHSLKLELQRQAGSLGQIVEMTSVAEPDADFLLISRSVCMKLKYVPEGNAVRSETEKEYGFERLSERRAPLAANLLKRLHKG